MLATLCIPNVDCTRSRSMTQRVKCCSPRCSGKLTSWQLQGIKSNAAIPPTAKGAWATAVEPGRGTQDAQHSPSYQVFRSNHTAMPPVNTPAFKLTSRCSMASGKAANLEMLQQGTGDLLRPPCEFHEPGHERYMILRTLTSSPFEPMGACN